MLLERDLIGMGASGKSEDGERDDAVLEGERYSAVSLPPRELAANTRSVLEPYLTPRRFAKGELLWREGDRSGMLVALLSGKVKIYRLLPSGKAVTLYIFGPGSLFGFMPLLDGTPYPAYAQALENCETQVIVRSSLREAIRNNPDVALYLFQHLSTRLREAFELIERLSSRGTIPKVASALLSLASEVYQRAPFTIITIPFSAKEFAQSLGMTPETFSRNVTHLIKRGVLKRLRKNRFQVLDLARLEEIAKHAIWLDT